MSIDIPDIYVEFRSDDEEDEPDEADNFYNQCDRLYDRVAAGYPVESQEYQCKKDNRYWLYKNRKKTSEPNLHGDLTYDQVFSVIGVNGRRFKKDSRVWLHKSSEKVARLRELERIAKLRHREKNSNCKFTPSYDDTGLDENSLNAMSNISICSDPNCLHTDNCSKRSHQILSFESQLVENGCRNKKRRKTGHSAPSSPAHCADSNFTVVSRSADAHIGLSNCLNRMDSDDSNDSHEQRLRSWKHEGSPQRWREFKIVSSASPVSSGGSIDLANGHHESAPSPTTLPSRDQSVHVKKTPKRIVSVYTIVNEDFYDYFNSRDKEL